MPTYIEPVSLEEVKAHLNVDPDYEVYDSLLLLYIKSAREFMEGELSLSLVKRTATDNIRVCCGKCHDGGLKWGPVTGLPVITSLAGKPVDAINTGTGEFPRYYFGYGVDVTYTAGYTPETIPANLKEALLLIVGHSYDMRGENVTIPQSVYQKMNVNSRNVF